MALLRLLSLLLVLFAWSSAQAGPLVSILKLRPTQMEIGKKAARFHVDYWKKEAKQKGMSLKVYAQEVLKPTFASTELPMVIDPAGNYRNTDGHHRVTALREISERTGVDFEVRPKILADYRGRSFGAYADHFINTLGKGQFTPKIEALPAVQRMRHLPATYGDLGNNPMRTALEMVFTKYDIKGSLMRDYVEFRAARRLLADGLLDKLHHEKLVGKHADDLPGHLATNKQVLSIITKRLARPEMRAYLLSEAKDEASRKVLAAKLDSLSD